MILCKNTTWWGWIQPCILEKRAGVCKNRSICQGIYIPFWVLFPAPWLSLSGNPSLSAGFWSFSADCPQNLNQLLSQNTTIHVVITKYNKIKHFIRKYNQYKCCCKDSVWFNVKVLYKKTFITTLHLFIKINHQNQNWIISYCLLMIISESRSIYLHFNSQLIKKSLKFDI